MLEQKGILGLDVNFVAQPWTDGIENPVGLVLHGHRIQEQEQNLSHEFRFGWKMFGKCLVARVEVLGVLTLSHHDQLKP